MKVASPHARHTDTPCAECREGVAVYAYAAQHACDEAITSRSTPASAKAATRFLSSAQCGAIARDVIARIHRSAWMQASAAKRVCSFIKSSTRALHNLVACEWKRPRAAACHRPWRRRGSRGSCACPSCYQAGASGLIIGPADTGARGCKVRALIRAQVRGAGAFTGAGAGACARCGSIRLQQQIRVLALAQVRRNIRSRVSAKVRVRVRVRARDCARVMIYARE